MRITDRVAAEGTPVVLPFPGRRETVVRLRADGSLTAEVGGSETVPGTWRWSRGELVVALEGSAVETRIPWRVLADQSSWTGR